MVYHDPLSVEAVVGDDEAVPDVDANGIRLHYDSQGEGEPIVLIMGIGAQMIVWPQGLIDTLVDRGFRVIRFDNRDVGLSSKIDHSRPGDIRKIMLRGMLRIPVEAPYTLMDMADDTAGLLDALGLDSAHIVGASMGGMVAQTLAITHPSRVRSLTSIMSNTGRRRDGLPAAVAMRALVSKAPRNVDEAVARAEEFNRICGSTKFEKDWDTIRETAARAYERCFYPRGFVRQMAAIAATPPRHQALKFVRVPTAVIHGSVDPLIKPSGGRATAKAIPGARLNMIDGMGHDMPRDTWPMIADDIAAVAQRADGPARRAAAMRARAAATARTS